MNCRYKKKKILEYIKDYVSISEKKPEAFDENEEETKNIASEVFAFLQSIDDHNDHLELFGER